MRLNASHLRMLLFAIMFGVSSIVYSQPQVDSSQRNIQAAENLTDESRISSLQSQYSNTVSTSPLFNLLPKVPMNTWFQVPDTKLKSVIEPQAYEEPIRGIIGPSGIIRAWNGAVWVEEEQRLDIIAAGGHADYCGNEYSSFNFEQLKWVKVHGPSDLTGYDHTTGKTPDGRPASRHTYQGQVYVPPEGKIYMFGGSLCSKSGVGNKDWWRVSLDGEYEHLGRTKGWASLGEHDLYDSVTGNIFRVKRNQIIEYNIASNSSTNRTRRQADKGWGASAAIDVDRRTIFVFGHRLSFIYNIDTGKKSEIVPTGDFSLIKSKGIGLLFVETIDQYVAWFGGKKLYFIHPETFHITVLEAGGSAPKANRNGVYGRFAYSAKHKTFIAVTGLSKDISILRLGKTPEPGENFGDLSLEDPQKYIKHAVSGGIVTIPPGIYLHGLLVNKPLTLNLAGVQLWGVKSGKGVVVVNSPGGPVIINDLVADGNKAGATSSNLAGVKIAGKNFDVTINRADISNTVMGVLTDNRGGKLQINDSYIHDTGDPTIKSNLSHTVYAGEIDSLKIINSRIERSNAQGHLVKSRARETVITNTRVDGDVSNHSRVVDLPCGGSLNITDSYFLQSPNADNNELFGFALERCGIGKQTAVKITSSEVIAGKNRSKLFSKKPGESNLVKFVDGGGNKFVGVKRPFSVQ